MNNDDLKREAERIFANLDFGCGCCSSKTSDETKKEILSELESVRDKALEDSCRIVMDAPCRDAMCIQIRGLKRPPWRRMRVALEAKGDENGINELL